MCGIVGRAGLAPAASRSWLEAGANALAHRGPDDAGIAWSSDGRVGLAHRRLAIIDLSPAGHQPMRDAALTIVYNGEIYNFRALRDELSALGHRFSSASDTEVILKAYQTWGADCVERLNGMFALAIHDAAAGQLFLARDRAGEKPLFFHLDQSTRELRFASELKALLADPAMPRRLDPRSLELFLTMGFVPGDRCILAGYAKLPPASALVLDLATGAVRQWRYWTPPAAVSTTPLSAEALADALQTRLAAAVGRQLVADVPVGVLLSGGVDSSLVTALAAAQVSRLRTFTVAFPGHGRFDESAHARQVAEHFGTDHETLVAQPATAALLPALAAQVDEPVMDSSIIPTFMVTAAVRQRATVALGGDGGDELFAGYSHHRRLGRLAAQAARVPRPLRRGLAAAALAVLPDGRRGRHWVRAAGSDLTRGVPLVATYFDQGARRRLLPAVQGIGDRPDVPWIADAGGTTLVDRAARVDFLTYLPEDILVKVDRAAMLNSLEVRAPFLDREVMEFALGCVPVASKADDRGGGKLILRRLAERLLPADFDRTRKQGFSIPLAAWLREGPYRALFEEVLLAPDSLFDRACVAHLLRQQDRGHQNEERLFGLVQFELWRRHYGVTL